MARTYMAKSADITREWYVVDASGQTLGRLATRVATVLRGKHKPAFTPHVDTGDFVVVLNAAQVRLTGQKAEDKVRYRHSGYPGGLKAAPYSKLMKERPERVVREAIWGMLPHNRLGRSQIRKLKVYEGAEHPHAAQKPRPLPGSSEGEND